MLSALLMKVIYFSCFVHGTAKELLEISVITCKMAWLLSSISLGLWRQIGYNCKYFLDLNNDVCLFVLVVLGTFIGLPASIHKAVFHGLITYIILLSSLMCYDIRYSRRRVLILIDLAAYLICTFYLRLDAAVHESHFESLVWLVFFFLRPLLIYFIGLIISSKLSFTVSEHFHVHFRISYSPTVIFLHFWLFFFHQPFCAMNNSAQDIWKPYFCRCWHWEG